MRISNQFKTKFAGLIVVVLCASLAVPALSFGQEVSPTTDQYGDQLTQLNQGVRDQDPPSDAGGSGLSGNVGPLPFTGFDVLAMAAVALAVTGLGLALQRAVSRDAEDLV